MHLVLSIDTSMREGKGAFQLIKNTKSPEYPDGNCKLAWDQFRFRYASKATTSLMRLKKIYENSVLESKRSDPELWISHLESIISEIKAIDVSREPSGARHERSKVKTSVAKRVLMNYEEATVLAAGFTAYCLLCAVVTP